MNLSNRKSNGKQSHHFTDFANAKGQVKSKQAAGKPSLSAFGQGLFRSKKSGGSKEGKPSSKKKILKRIGVIFSLTFLFGILFGILFLLGIVSAYSKGLPNIDDYFNKTSNENLETIIVDRNGKELYRIRGDELKERVDIKDVPDKLQRAFLSAEDAEFKNHKGLNIFGLVRTLTCTLKNHSSSGCGGGSSITQQLVKITTGKDERSVERKAKEAIQAMKVEQEYSKDKILEFYLNVVPEGGILNGVKTGSKYMFGKENLNDLSLAEMAYLAAIPNEPSVLSPWGGSYYNPERSQDRATYVLDRMLELKDRTGVTEGEVNQAKIDLSSVKFKTGGVDKKAPHYVDYVIEQLNTMYADKVPEGRDGYEFLRDKGYTVTTAVDLDTQTMLEDTIRTQVKDPKFQKEIGAQNAAAVMMDPRNGEILALVGSRDFNEESTDPKFSPQANAALYPRSMGSTNKPVLYMASFMNGYNPSSIVPDIPLDLRTEGSTVPFNVRNYGGTTGAYGQFLPMRIALQRSLNIPAVSAYQITGGSNYEETYKKLNGWDGLKIQGPAAPLGATNIPLIEQVHAYATLASEGTYHPKKVILKITDNQGKVILDNTAVEGKQVVDKKFTFLINDMNRRYWLFCGPLCGFNYSDPLLVKIGQSMDIAGKTGTSDTSANGTGDVAFISYTPTFTLGMWAGNSCDPSKCPINGNATGEALYNNLYKQFLEKYWTQIKPAKYTVPEGVKKAEICSLTGRAKSDLCTQAGGQIISEWVADTSLPKPEDMIVKLSVTQCPDVDKLARQIDKNLNLATDKFYIQYNKIFTTPSLQSQVAAYLAKSGKMPPTQECGITRNIQPTTVTFISPLPSPTLYTPGQDIQISATVTGDVPISKVEVADWNGNIVQTYSSAPFNVNYTIMAPLVSGTYKITVVATDSNSEVKQERVFVVDVPPSVGSVVITAPKKNAQLSKSSTPKVSLTASFSNVPPADLAAATFRTKINGVVTPIPSVANPSNMSATWEISGLPNNTDYIIEAFVSGKVLESVNVTVKP